MDNCIRQIFDMLRAISWCTHPGSKKGVGQSLDQYLPQGTINFVIRQREEFIY